MKKKLILIGPLAIMIFTLSAFINLNTVSENPANNSTVGHNMPSLESGKLHSNMRKLWEDHIVWTRNVIFCLADNLPGKDHAIKRLMQNQDDIGNAIKPYYGEDAGNKLAALLHDHIEIAAEIINLAKMNDEVKLAYANKKWTANADEISDFLSKANPNWNKEEMQEMMHTHLKLTNNEVVARLKKDYNADIRAYDQVHDEILEMSDMLSSGIIKQFPDKFN